MEVAYETKVSRLFCPRNWKKSCINYRWLKFGVEDLKFNFGHVKYKTYIRHHQVSMRQLESNRAEDMYLSLQHKDGISGLDRKRRTKD